MTEHAPDLEETPARQGSTGTGLRWVLRISLVLVVVAFAAIWAVFAAHHGAGPGGQTSTGQAVATGSAPAQAAGRQAQTTGG